MPREKTVGERLRRILEAIRLANKGAKAMDCVYVLDAVLEHVQMELRQISADRVSALCGVTDPQMGG